jgi:predicted dehydrogenase
MLKIGVLGAGNLGKTHIRLIREIGAYELVGFYDPVKTTAESVESEFNVRAFPSAELLLEECDVIDITTPTSQYYRIADKAIRLSKHVFIEKPFTNSVAETKSLMRLAAEANNKVQVGQIERFNPAFMASRQHIADPFYIETQRLCQMNSQNESVSVVMDLMINDIDIVLSLVRSNIKKISATGVVVVSDSPDIVNARIEFDNGAVANLTASRISLETKHQSRFFRRDAYISVDFLGNTANIVSQNQQKQELEIPVSLVEEERYRLLNNMVLDKIEVTPSNAIKMQLESFSNAIINNTRPLVPIDDGYNALGVANKIIDQLLLNANFAAAHTIIA